MSFSGVSVDLCEEGGCCLNALSPSLSKTHNGRAHRPNQGGKRRAGCYCATHARSLQTTRCLLLSLRSEWCSALLEVAGDASAVNVRRLSSESSRVQSARLGAGTTLCAVRDSPAHVCLSEDLQSEIRAGSSYRKLP